MGCKAGKQRKSIGAYRNCVVQIRHYQNLVGWHSFNISQLVVCQRICRNSYKLLSNYCKNECPICGFLPLATEEKNICSVTVRLLKALREDELENMKNQLLEISQDGKIRDDEVEAVRKISEYLDGIAEE